MTRIFITGTVASRWLWAGCWALTLCAATVLGGQQDGAEAPGTSGKLRGSNSKGSATNGNSAPDSGPVARLVSTKEGRRIAAEAVGQEEPVRGAQDCSHLVQQIYARAGYEYPYASSFELYAGHGNFRRVRHAQPGDLITWPGHVGIVVDPRQHSFYSLVRSGLQTEDYLGPYWRSRGTPRFYRYVLGSAPVETAKLASPTRPVGKNRSARSSTASAEVREDADDGGAPPSTEEATLRTKVMAQPPQATVADAEPAERAAASASEILVTAEQRRPTSGEMLDAMARLSDGAASALRSTQDLAASRPIVVYDQLRVQRLETKRDRGWVELQIESHVRIAGEGPDFKRRHEKARWELRRDSTGWAVFAPADCGYLSRDAAVRVLAAQLAELAESEAAVQHDENVIGKEARLANLLSALLEK